MIIELPIFLLNDETREKDAAGIDYSIDECDIVNTTFYNISCIYKYIDESKKNYTTIRANGEKWVCPKSYDEVQQLISKSLSYEIIPN